MLVSYVLRGIAEAFCNNRSNPFAVSVRCRQHVIEMQADDFTTVVDKEIQIVRSAVWFDSPDFIKLTFFICARISTN